MPTPHLVFASDHRGADLRRLLIKHAEESGFAVTDLGTTGTERVDAQDYAVQLCDVLKSNPDYLGVLICGSGQSMAMTANRFPHIRAALCHNTTTTRLAREHNHANVLAMGAHIVGEELARDMLLSFVKTQPLGGRYAERVAKLNHIFRADY